MTHGDPRAIDARTLGPAACGGVTTAKQHLLVLDGLRGTAAVAVVIDHFQNTTIGLVQPHALLFRHGHLAVDFFYCLSGYIIGYAYDRRRESMTTRRFLIARLVRLHPMVLVGTLFGLLSFMVDPFAFRSGFPDWMAPRPEPAWKVAAAAIGGTLLLPTWPLPYRSVAYFPLNAPAWSLMWEYLATLAYAFVLWRIPTRMLGILVGIAGIGLVAAAYGSNTLNIGWGWGQEFAGLVRTTFSFTAGLLLFRKGAAASAAFPRGFIVLSLMMAVIFVVPISMEDSKNWMYESAVVILVFPLIVSLGADSTVSGTVEKVCIVFGRISYPLYLVNFPVVILYIGYYWTVGIPVRAVHVVTALLTFCCIGLAYVVLVGYDEPVRRRLARALSARTAHSVTISKVAAPL